MPFLSPPVTPSVTVLMTVFNAGRFLDASIESIVGQTFRDFEFLVVDDCSTDGSRERAESWAGRDSRVRVIGNAANKGQTACLNQGLREARGEWIARQDADDLSHRERFARQCERVQRDPELALLGTQGVLIDERDQKIGLLDVPYEMAGIRWTARLMNPFLHTSVFFRRRAAMDLGGYDESFRIAQDYDLWARMLAKHDGANLSGRLVAYRHLEKSLSKSGRGLAFEEARRVADRLGDGIFNDGDLAASFREGLEPNRRDAFWKAYEKALSVSPIVDPADMARTRAMHHLKVAGAMDGAARGAAAIEVIHALRSDARFSARWLWERSSRGGFPANG